MEKEVTLGEIFAKSNVDELNGYFDSEKFNKDVEQMSKAETEQLLGQIQSEIIKGGDYEVLSSMRTIALNHIEKARSGVYADTAENRKLGRVGQQYGGKKQEAAKGSAPEKSEEEQWKVRTQKAFKKEMINEVLDDGGNASFDKFMESNHKYYADYLKGQGFDSYEDFTEYFSGDDDIKNSKLDKYKHDEDAWYEKMNKIWTTCAKKIPAEVYATDFDKRFKEEYPGR